ncbi:MAG: hypothetical protein JST20_12820 [Bacteroidetes bacterium]|nr:hypothetical protein [Bacteroidota bacterium]
MFYRITKYNPKFRDEYGGYTVDEWIDYSCIGYTYNGKVFTREEYEIVENKYVTVITTAFRSSGVTTLFINQLTKHYYNPKEPNSDEDAPRCPDNIVTIIERGWIKTVEDLEEISKAILLGYIWAELTSPYYILNITFGYDYYMYVETMDEKVIQAIIQNLPEGMYIDGIDDYKMK